jgi:hypothetical protein
MNQDFGFFVAIQICQESSGQSSQICQLIFIRLLPGQHFAVWPISVYHGLKPAAPSFSWSPVLTGTRLGHLLSVLLDCIC